MHIDPPGGYEPPSVEDAWQRLRDGLDPAPAPKLLRRTDGRGLLHEGASVLLFGPGGAGKTMLTQWVTTSMPMVGRSTTWLDLDNMGFDELIARAAQLGIGDLMLTSATLRYFAHRSFDSLDALLVAAAREGSDSYVIDSMSGLLMLGGVDGEEKNLAVREVIDRAIEHVRRGRQPNPTVLFIDHTGLQPGRPRAASSKLQAVDQGIEVVVVTPLARGRSGKLRLISRKDRRGYWADGQAIADVVIDATTPMMRPLDHLGFHIDVTCYPVSKIDENRAQMEAISLVLEAADPGDVKWSEIKATAPVSTYSNADQKRARDMLDRRGFIEQEQLGSHVNSPIVVRLVKPYRAALDDEADS